MIARASLPPLLLRLARVDVDSIVRDYEETDERMRPVRNVADDARGRAAEGTGRERFVSSLAERGHPIRTVVARVDDRYGSVGAYLEEHGTTRTDIERVVDRIRVAGVSGAAGSS